MASYYSASHSVDVAAIAAVAGLRAPSESPALPVRVLAFHGLRDRINPYAGGFDVRWRESVVEAAVAWAKANSHYFGGILGRPRIV